MRKRVSADVARKKGLGLYSSTSVSFRQKSRNAVDKPMESDKPQNFAELAPRGPMQVKNQVVGTLVENGEGGIVIPDPSFKETNFGPVYISKENMNGAPYRMVVVAEVLNPQSSNQTFRGKIVEVIGDVGNNDVRMATVMHQFGLSQTFPPFVMDEVKDLPVNPPDDVIEAEIAKGRRDLRNLLTITMDGEEAKDLDDAISIEPCEDNCYRLYVHIADVSHYVREKTELDKEAFLRATSVYLVDRVVPMLPPKLSNGLCSLNPNVPRLTLTAEMLIDEHGNTIAGDVYESVIQSNMRTSYNECFKVLFKPSKDDVEKYGDIIQALWDMKRLTDILKKQRDDRGAINFDFPETKVELDTEGNPVKIYPYPINYCHGMIEQFMIAANEFVARKFAMLNYPFVYRVHEDPDRMKITRFCTVAKNFGAMGTIRGKITPKVITDYMSTIRNESVKPCLDTILLRSMAKAKYSQDNLGHFGLASEFYCHFTSPIRRYPDLYIHRIIKSYLHDENLRKHFAGLVAEVADHSSDMERNSVEAERQSVAVKVAMYMHERLGEHYVGKISSIIGAGVFVELENSCEGFVAFRTMKDHYIFDEVTLRAVGRHSGNTLMIGQEVNVIVAAVDLDLNRVDFVFDENAPKKSKSEDRASSKKDRDTGRKSSKKGEKKASSRREKVRVNGKTKKIRKLSSKRPKRK
ncbi:MAG: ribonuclease R [Clostridia bacterium]|nr:ribonuclease R [Clostridia bacterium]